MRVTSLKRETSSRLESTEVIKDRFLTNESVQNEKDVGNGDDKKELSRRVKWEFVQHAVKHFPWQVATTTLSVRCVLPSSADVNRSK